MIVTQAYGGGLRYHCSECDTKGTMPGGTVKCISWTNGTPPKDCSKCTKPKKRKRRHAKN